MTRNDRKNPREEGSSEDERDILGYDPRLISTVHLGPNWDKLLRIRLIDLLKGKKSPK